MYAEPAREYIERHGGEVRLGAPARVAIENGRGTVLAGGERWTAPAVVVAVPWFALPDLFDGETQPLQPLLAAARTTEASPIVTVNIWFDRPVLERAFVGLPGRTMQWVFDKRAVHGDSASHVSTVSSGAREMLERTNDQIIDLALRELGEALPDARAARVLRTTVIREPRATFSLAPGQPVRPGTTTAVPNLFLAGDWVDTGLPATIESAVVSGDRAAAAVIRSQRDLGISFLPSRNPAILTSH
jgi:protoporphyrinogen oxidase